jgi:hypothetical protein
MHAVWKISGDSPFKLGNTHISLKIGGDSPFKLGNTHISLKIGGDSPSWNSHPCTMNNNRPGF